MVLGVVFTTDAEAGQGGGWKCNNYKWFYRAVPSGSDFARAITLRHDRLPVADSRFKKIRIRPP